MSRLASRVGFVLFALAVGLGVAALPVAAQPVSIDASALSLRSARVLVPPAARSQASPLSVSDRFSLSGRAAASERFATPRSLARADASAPRASDPAAASGGPSPFVRGLRGAAIGTVVGGGLGLLIGEVPFEAFEGSRDCSRERCTFDDADDDGSIHMVIPGVWLGSLIGALAGTSADTDGETLILTGGGAALVGILGALGGAAVGGGSRWETVVGYGVGASVGAAAGIAARSRDTRSLVRLRDGRLRLGTPDVGVAPAPGGSGVAPRVQLFHARF